VFRFWAFQRLTKGAFRRQTARGPAASVDEVASLIDTESGSGNSMRLGSAYLYSYSNSQTFKTAP
jgi:hypothetical protein